MIPDAVIPMLYGNDYFAAVLFLSPKSPKWQLVKHLCQQADATAEGVGYFAAAFHKKRESLNLLSVVADMVYTWKSAHIFVQKRKIAYLFSVKWLNCYFKSLPCEDSRAWCLSVTKAPVPIDFFQNSSIHMHRIDIVVHTEPFLPDVKLPEKVAFEENFVCPCKQLGHYRWGHIELPSSLKDQFQAFAIEQGYAECPNFDLEQFVHIKPPYDITPSHT